MSFIHKDNRSLEDERGAHLVRYWDRQYRRYGPYGVHPAAVVVPPVVVPQPAPVVPPVVVELQPVIVVPPPRPASCGEYRY
jgi:hypothetical protein